MGRKKIADPKDIQIRITRGVKRELALFKINHHLPAKYKEGDIVEALLWQFGRKELELEELQEKDKV
jgi:hypothetical protein